MPSDNAPNTPAGGAVDPERLAQLETQVCDARNAWSQHFEARYLHNDDVPDLDHFIALWVAERMPATVPVEAVLALAADLRRRANPEPCKHLSPDWLAGLSDAFNQAANELEALTRGEK